MERFLRLTLTLLGPAMLGLFALSGPASATVVTIDGAPLNVFTNESGNLQAKFDSDQDALFFPPGDEEGDGSLFIGIPTPGGLQGAVYGPGVSGAQTAQNAEFTPISQGAVTGTGTSVDPFTQVTDYKVAAAGKDYLAITQTITYVQSEKKFNVSYAVENVTSPAAAFRFRASSAADLFIEGSDEGTGLLDLGPPRFVAGANNSTGRAGGMVESPTSPWTSYQVANYSDIWSIVGAPLSIGFDNTLIEDVQDNGVGVQWDEYYGVGQGLPAGDIATFEVTWRFAVVVPLILSPSEGTSSVGKTHQITATATDVTGAPLIGKTVRYSVAGVSTGAGTAAAPTNSEGKAEIGIKGTAVGRDNVTVFVDLNDNGTRETNEPQVIATIDWTEAKPPPPPSPAGIVIKGPLKVDKNGHLNVSVSCPGTSSESGCEGDIAGRMTVRRRKPAKSHKKKSHKKSHKSQATASKKKKKKRPKGGTVKYVIPASHYKLEQKTTGNVPMVLSPDSLKALKKMKTGIVQLTSRAVGKPPQSAIGVVHRP